MNIFIDTNVYLTFFHYSDEDLEELKKLIVAIKNRKMTLFVPNQVIDEFNRNREEKIADSLKTWVSNPIPKRFPQICRENPMLYKKLKDSVKQYEEAQNEVLNETYEKVKTNGFNADSIIKELFKVSKVIPTNNNIYHRAQIRVKLGNPPGKNGSYGDAVNWEALKEGVPANQDLYFITEDGDYLSPVKTVGFSQYLLNEWNRDKKSEIHFYSRISDFFRAHYPDVKLAAELEKDFLIENLRLSGMFKYTHECVARLSAIEEFTSTQLNTLLKAYIENDQVHSIGDDPDIKAFYDSLIKKNISLINNEIYLEYLSVRSLYVHEEGESLPIAS